MTTNRHTSLHLKSGHGVTEFSAQNLKMLKSRCWSFSPGTHNSFPGSWSCVRIMSLGMMDLGPCFLAGYQPKVISAPIVCPQFLSCPFSNPATKNIPCIESLSYFKSLLPGKNLSLLGTPLVMSGSHRTIFS